MITNAVLGGIADTVAQSITAIKLAALRKPGGLKDDDTMAIEIHELDRKNPLNQNDLIPDSKYLPPPFDFERLTRFMAYPFMMAPVQFKWFQFLSKAFPITKSSRLGPAMKMVALDQLIFAPIGMLHLRCEEGTANAFIRNRMFLHCDDRCRRWRTTSSNPQTPRYVPANSQGQLHGLAVSSDHQFPTNANTIPTGKLLQCIRLLVLTSIQPFVSTVGIAWIAYLSLSNAAEEADAKSAPSSPNIRLL